MQQNKALNLLSLARKGRRIEVGEEPVGSAARSGHARLIVVAADTSEHTLRRVQHWVSGSKQPYLSVPWDKDTLGAALGRSSCAVAAITDVALALAFVRALGNEEEHAELLADLEARTERVKKRQKEAKAHRYNVRHGRK